MFGKVELQHWQGLLSSPRLRNLRVNGVGVSRRDTRHGVLDAGPDSLWLQGVGSPDGSRHDGTKCHALISEIREIIEWKEEK
jgi:hypothetical protein